MKSTVTTATLLLLATLSHAATVDIPSSGYVIDLGMF